MLYLDEERVRSLLGWDQLIPAMERALAAFSRGQVVQPVRNMLTIEEGRRYLGIMPAVADEAMGAKLVSFFPGKRRNGCADPPRDDPAVSPRHRRTPRGHWMGA